MLAKKPVRWCAVYTRKSSEEGLEQEFNSLEAQREAGAAYVKSQANEGWRLLSARYDDGGYSGGNLERPALSLLLEDIRTGKVQTVVVYKVDRLTRSLSDFARLIEVFEGHGVSFVSVTQQFNTTTSMGRLMLNVLLSFAQFEREVTGERIRDKIAASKRKGMWMGGVAPIGYQLKDRKLIVDQAQAEVVRHIFRRYAELGSVAKLMRELYQDGYRTKSFTSASGRAYGGRPFSRGHLYRILVNRTYLGEIVHNDAHYPGEHEAIVDLELWNRVHELLAANRHEFLTDQRVESASLLKGLIYDDAGNRMSPCHANKRGRRYRYYVSQAIVQRRPEEAGSLSRVPAAELEKLVIDSTIKALGEDEGARLAIVRFKELEVAERGEFLRRVINRVEVGSKRIRITVDPSRVDDLGKATDLETTEPPACRPAVVEVPFEFVQRGGRSRIMLNGNAAKGGAPDPALTKAVVRAHQWSEQLLGGKVNSVSELARRNRVDVRYVARIVRLGFLAPDIVEAILDGKSPPGLTLEQLRKPVPLDWDRQRQLLGFVTG